jgi:hypothetical protein
LSLKAQKDQRRKVQYVQSQRFSRPSSYQTKWKQHLKALVKQSNNPQSFDGGMEIVLSNFKEIVRTKICEALNYERRHHIQLCFGSFLELQNADV